MYSIQQLKNKMSAFIQRWRTKKYYFLFLSLISGVLLSLSWYEPFTILAFFALAPLLELESQISVRKLKRPTLTYFLYGWLAFLIWNVGVIWWLWNAAGWATLGAWIANSLLQTLPLVLFQIARKASADKYKSFGFVVFWLSFEYVHLHWDLSWVWLNLGNIFANTPSWVQWYSLTGSFGGTLWILLVNILIFKWVFQQKLSVYVPALLIVIPMAISLITYFTYEEKGEKMEMVVIQPNLDCYTEKFHYNAKTGVRNQPTFVPYEEQLKRYISLSEPEITPKTGFLLFPETALHSGMETGSYQTFADFRKVNDWIKKYPNLALISGVDAYTKYGEKAGNSPTERYTDGYGYYDVYGSSILISGVDTAEFYHKSQLVIGAETIPFGGLLKPLIMNFGGTSGGLGRQANREVFTNGIGKAAPVICYESIYGDFMTGYMREGANFIAIITNDGWWGNTSGHKQHWNYAKLRAIESRKAVARSANTGISGFISQRGETINRTNYDEMIALKSSIHLNNELTFYDQHGDYLGRLASFLAPFMLIAAFIKKRLVK